MFSRKTKVAILFCALLLLLPMLFFYPRTPAIHHIEPREKSCEPLPDNLTKHPLYRLGALTSTNAERIRRARSTCSLSKGLGGYVDRMTWNSRMRTAYCVVPKTSCTFWISLFSFLKNHTNADVDQARLQGQSPLRPNVPRFKMHQDALESSLFGGISSSGHLDEELGDYFRFLFVRNPYSRLWSAYIDKFLLIDFWQYHGETVHQFLVSSEGQEVLRRTGQSYVHAGPPGCYADFTFAQFATFVAFSQPGHPERLDEHWRPVQYLCDPCVFCPHHVGHVETFQQDSAPVLERLNLSWVLDNHKHEEHQTQMLVQDNYQTLQQRSPDFYSRCTNPLDVARRLWKAFQMYGYLPESAHFPGSLLGEEPTAEKVTEVVLKTHRSVAQSERSGLSQQRRVAMEEAYRTVPSEVLEKLSSVYMYEFVAFGYEMRPPELFGHRYVR